MLRLAASLAGQHLSPSVTPSPASMAVTSPFLSPRSFAPRGGGSSPAACSPPLKRRSLQLHPVLALLSLTGSSALQERLPRHDVSVDLRC